MDAIRAFDQLDTGTNLAIGVLIGAAIAIVWHYVCEWSDRRVDDMTDRALAMEQQHPAGKGRDEDAEWLALMAAVTQLALDITDALDEGTLDTSPIYTDLAAERLAAELEDPAAVDAWLRGAP